MGDKENFLKETVQKLLYHGKTPKDVLWVGMQKSWTTWQNFQDVADFEYDSGYGSQQIVEDLIIVGKDWWLERGEYDGSEWWEFKQYPVRPEEIRSIKTIQRADCWDSFRQRMRGEDDE